MFFIQKKAKREKSQGGQILILMLLFLTTFIILFGYAVSVGHLVHSKMNLQNSIDLAAMSGASWQARYLNGFSELNYRMRQNHKWFIFDMYTTLPKFNQAFRQRLAQSGGANDRFPEDKFYYLSACQQAHGYNPSIEIGESGSGTRPGTNFCLQVKAGADLGSPSVGAIPEIRTLPAIVTLLPPIAALNAALIQLRENVRAICSDSTGQNEVLVEYLVSKYVERQEFIMKNGVPALMRDFADAFPGNGDTAVGDITIRKSFENNLIGSFRSAIAGGNSSSIFFLNDSSQRSTGADFSEYFQTAETFFNLPYIVFEASEGDAGGPSCIVTPKIYSHEGAIPVGFTRFVDNEFKRPLHTVLGTMARNKTLFWPRQNAGNIGSYPLMAALAAAKPFGSRIGPPKDYYELELSLIGLPGGAFSPMANMSFFPGDHRLGIEGGLPGIGRISLLKYALSLTAGQNSGINQLRPGGSLDASNAFDILASAPTVYDSLYFGIFPEVLEGNKANPFVPNDSLSSPSIASFLGRDARDVLRLGDRNGFAPKPTFARVNDTLSQRFPDSYATHSMVASGWSPSPDEDQRYGYQIKLISFEKLCQEVQIAGGVRPEICGALSNLGVTH